MCITYMWTEVRCIRSMWTEVMCIRSMWTEVMCIKKNVYQIYVDRSQVYHVICITNTYRRYVSLRISHLYHCVSLIHITQSYVSLICMIEVMCITYMCTEVRSITYSVHIYVSDRYDVIDTTG